MATQLFFFPAFGRLLHGINPTTLSLALCFYLAGSVYDFVTRRRVHPAYRWGVPLLILTMPPFTVMASQWGVWHSVVEWMVDFVGSGKFEFKHDAEAGDDRFYKFARAKPCFALHIGADEGTQHEVWRRGLND
jgi:hypothetical protein